MKTSDEMRRMIGHFEGCKLHPYRDPIGIWTIGYGHTGKDVYAGCGAISQARADELLSKDLEHFERAVTRLCPTTNQQQFDALVSFSYNCGEGNLGKSTLRTKHNAGDYAGAALEFGKWNKAGGKVLAGLTRRRKAESRVYRDGEYSTDAG